MELCLEQCHDTPTITIGVISVSRFRDAGFELAFMHYGISVSKNNMFYFNAFPIDEIFEINMDGVISIDKYVFHVAKRTNYDLNMTFLWHFDLFLKSDYMLQESSRSDDILDEIQDTPIEPQTKEPSSSSILLRVSKLVVKEDVSTNVVEQAPPENQ
ncbi:hypothetical protein Tco_1040666 [Tanacetum coccineum]